MHPQKYQIIIDGVEVHQAATFKDALDHLTANYPHVKHLFGQGISIKPIINNQSK